MSTHKHFDRICVAVVVCALLITMLFMNGESLGIRKIVDEDAESYTGSLYFTANDLNGDWDSQGATQIVLNGDSTRISGQGAYVYGGDVYISGGGYYAVSGTLENGSIVVDAYSNSKVWLLLDGVDITCSEDACIRVEQADKVFLTLAAGSENALSSGAVYSDTALAEGRDGAIFARDDLTINGSGSLTVQAQYAHGIAANDDLVITGGDIAVTAVKDGINAHDSLRIKDTDITVMAEDDGLVVSEGYLYVESGNINVTSAEDGIHTAQDVTVAGGELAIAAGDDGIHADTAITVMDGTVLISECYEGLEAVAIDVSGGTITIYPTDDGFNANGGSGDMFGMGGFGMGGFGADESGTGGPGMGGFGSGESDTGSPGMGGGPPSRGGFGRGGFDAGTSDADTSGADASETGSSDMSAEKQSEREQPGSIDTAQTDNGQQGSVDTAQTDNGQAGSADTTQTDMAQADSAESDEETYIRISGGTITIINETAQDADGLDSNGDIYISGGTIRISLVNTGSNSALDYGSESGGVCEISGGNIIACGSSSMAESFDSTSTQCSILYNISQGIAAGTKLALEDAAGAVILEYEVPCSFSSAVISCPEMVLGESYLVVIGDDVEEVTLDETSASFGDAQSSMFGGSMNGGGMQDRGDFSGMQGGPKGSSDMQRPDGSVSDGDFMGGNFMGESVSGGDSMGDNSMGGSPMGGNPRGDDFTGGSPMDGSPTEQGAETATAEDVEETKNGSGIALTEYGTDTWILLGTSVLALAAGIVVARLYRRQGF